MLPSSPGDNALTLVIGILGKLNKNIQESLDGSRPKNGFMLTWRKSAEELADTFLDNRPKIILPNLAPTSASTITISDDEDMPDVSTPLTPRKRYSRTDSESPTKKTKFSPAENGQKETGTRVRLEEIRHELQAFTGNKLENKADTGVASLIICKARASWRDLVLGFVHHSEKLLRDEIIQSLHSSLGNWTNTALFHETVEQINNFVSARSAHLAENVAHLAENVAHLLNAELQEPFTFDKKTMGIYEKEEGDELIKRFRDKLLENQPNTALESGAKGKLNVQAASNTHPEDAYKYEIEVMATAKAYYKLASASLLDHVAKAVTFDLFEHTRKDLETYLLEALKVTENDGM